MIGIYKFTNKITGESYIGQSLDIQKRYTQHKNRHDHKKIEYENSYFHMMLRHYGFENFDFEILEECSAEQLNDREIYYIDLYNSYYPNGYNKTRGGNLPHYSTLSQNEIDEIKHMLKSTSVNQNAIADMFNVHQNTVSLINLGKMWFCDNEDYPIRKRSKTIRNRSKTIHQCCICGNKLPDSNDNGICFSCSRKLNRKCERPSKEELFNMLCKHSFSYVGSKYGVSDNAVRKWCMSYDIPKHAKDYKAMPC